MSSGGSVLFDRSSSLPQESQRKLDLSNRQFVDPRALDQDVFSDDFRPKQKNPKELLPHIPLRDEPFSETGPIDFDRSFLMQPKETLKSPPIQVEKPILPPPEPEILELAPLEKQSELSQMFQGTVNMLGAVWARIVDDIYETRAAGHERTNETLHTHVKKRNHINQGFFENIDKIHENSKKEETWSFMYNIVEFLTISTGLIGGIGLVTVGAYVPGLEMIAGSVLSMGSFALKQLNYDTKYVGALALSGALITGCGFWKGFAAIERLGGLAKTLAAINDGALSLSKTFMNYVRLGTQKTRNLLEGSNNELTIERLKNYDDIRKTVGSFKMEDLIELSKAASEQIRMKGEVISRILLGSKT